MRYVYTDEFNKMMDSEKNKLSNDAIASMKNILNLFNIIIDDMSSKWYTTEWVDQDGYIHLIPHPEKTEITRDIRKELNTLYNSFFLQFTKPATLSKLLITLDEKYDIDIYQIAGCIMAANKTVYWYTSYIGPLVAILADCN